MVIVELINTRDISLLNPEVIGQGVIRLQIHKQLPIEQEPIRRRPRWSLLSGAGEPDRRDLVVGGNNVEQRVRVNRHAIRRRRGGQRAVIDHNWYIIMLL